MLGGKSGGHVNLFFGLSGFVLAAAYEDRLRSGLTAFTFMQYRLARIYPMYLLGALLALATQGGMFSTLFMIPPYPANPPMWTLVNELIVNFAFAVFIYRMATSHLIMLIALSGLLLLLGILAHGSVAEIPGYGWAIVRASFSYFLGVLFWRMHQAYRPARRETKLGWVLFPAFAALTIFTPVTTPVWDSICILALLPALVWLGTVVELPNVRVAEWLGSISFPLYCIHVPIVAVFLSPDGSQLQMTAVCLLCIFASRALDKRIDRPARAWLASLVSQRTSKMSPA